MRYSDQWASLAAALVVFQAECPNIPKNAIAKVTMKAGGGYQFEFADMARIRDIIRPALAKAKLGYTSGAEPAPGIEGGLAITTRVFHESGEWMEQTAIHFPDDSRPQAIGSAQTYGIRYNLVAMLGLASDGGDDDGNAASGNRADISPRGGTPARTAPAAEAPKGPATFGTVFAEGLRASLAKVGMTVKELRAIMLENGVPAETIPSDDPLTWHKSEQLHKRIKAFLESKQRVKGEADGQG